MLVTDSSNKLFDPNLLFKKESAKFVVISKLLYVNLNLESGKYL